MSDVQNKWDDKTYTHTHTFAYNEYPEKLLSYMGRTRMLREGLLGTGVVIFCAFCTVLYAYQPCKVANPAIDQPASVMLPIPPLVLVISNI